MLPDWRPQTRGAPGQRATASSNSSITATVSGSSTALGTGTPAERAARPRSPGRAMQTRHLVNVAELGDRHREIARVARCPGPPPPIRAVERPCPLGSPYPNSKRRPRPPGPDPPARSSPSRSRTAPGGRREDCPTTGRDGTCEDRGPHQQPFQRDQIVAHRGQVTGKPRTGHRESSITASQPAAPIGSVYQGSCGRRPGTAPGGSPPPAPTRPDRTCCRREHVDPSVHPHRLTADIRVQAPAAVTATRCRHAGGHAAVWNAASSPSSSGGRTTSSPRTAAWTSRALPPTPARRGDRP